MVEVEQQPQVHDTVFAILEDEPMLSHKRGKMVHELRPAVDWGKGQAVQWLLAAFSEAQDESDTPFTPVYLGDDVADEDAFKFVEAHGGVGIKVSDVPVTMADTAASLQVTQEQVVQLLAELVSIKLNL